MLDLAPEPFSAIISLIGTREWIALWICGNRKLQWRLSKGKAVREMTIRWLRFSQCPWPSQVIHLDGLESFSLSHKRFEGIKTPSTIRLADLSPNLKNLELDCKPALVLYKDLQVSNPDQFPNLEMLSLSFELEKSWKLAIPSTVTDLRLEDFGNFYHLSVPISLLPPGLTRLKCKCIWVDADASFPTSLTYLKIAEEGIISKERRPSIVFQMLPPAVEHVLIDNPWESRSTVTSEDWNALSTLTNLKSLRFNLYGPMLSEKAQMIPRSVERLTLGFVRGFLTDESCIELLKALPKNLKTLEGLFPEEITSAIAQSLPKTLETVGKIVSCDAVAFLPDTIVEMEVDSSDFQVVSSFPSKLSHLKIASITPWTVAKLPAHLQSLQVQSIDLSPGLLSSLPKNLTQLDTGRLLDPKQPIELLFKALPRTLTSFQANKFQDRVGPVPTPSNSSLFLPSGMKTLDLGNLDFSMSDMSVWIRGLPVTLTSLGITITQLQKGHFTSLGALSALQELSLLSLASPSDGWAHCLDFRSLPSNLTTCHISDSTVNFKDSDINNDTLIGAPLHLTSLNLPPSPLLTKAVIAHLPNLDEITFGVIYEYPPWAR